MARRKILLTPDLAREMLANNYEDNRKIRRSTVSRYANDIKEGRWNYEVSRFQDPIILSKNGALLNGQHRCSAVVEADTPIYTYIEDGADESIFKFLDDGEKRGTRDYVKTPNAHAVSSLAKIMCAIEDGDAPLVTALYGKMSASRNIPSVSRQQVLEKIESDEERILEFVRLGMRAQAYLGNKRGHISAALFIIDFCGRGDMISRFVDECSLIAPTSQPIIVLRSYVAKCLTQANFRSDYKWMCSCIFTAYEAFRNGTELKSFNKLSIYFSQYDKFVSEARDRNKED